MLGLKSIYTNNKQGWLGKGAYKEQARAFALAPLKKKNFLPLGKGMGVVIVLTWGECKTLKRAPLVIVIKTTNGRFWCIKSARFFFLLI